MLKKILSMYKNNPLYVILPILSIITFSLWLFSVDGYIVTGIFILLFFVFLKLKLPKVYLLMLLIFSLPSYHGNFKILDYEFKFVLPFHTLSVFVGSVYIRDMIMRKNFYKGKLFYPLLAIFIYSLISVLWSPQKLVSLNAVLLIGVSYMSYFIIINFNDDEHIKLAELSVILMTFGLVLSLEIFTIYLRMATKNSNNIDFFLHQIWDNPNLFAALYAFIIPISLYKYRNFKWNLKYMIFIVLDLLIIYGMYLTRSRGIYLGAAVAIVLSFFIYKFKPKITFIIFTLAGVAFFFVTIFIIVLKDAYPGLYQLYYNVSTYRILWYEVAYNNFIETPFNAIFGTGVKSSVYYISQINHPHAYYHSFIFQIMGTLGVIGLILYLWSYVKMYGIFKDIPKQYSLILVAVFMHLGHEIVDIGFEYQYLGMFFYILVAYVERSCMFDKNHNLIENNLEIEKSIS